MCLQRLCLALQYDPVPPQNLSDPESLNAIGGYKVLCEHPNNHLYRFEGSVTGLESSTGHTVNNDNVMLRGTMLRNTPFVIGIATYTGLDSKLMSECCVRECVQILPARARVRACVLRCALCM